jgi:hypothetical protein
MFHSYQQEAVLVPFGGNVGTSFNVLLILWPSFVTPTVASTDQQMEACGFSKMDDAGYSPDLAPCDFFLFGRLKQDLAGQ